MGGEDLTVGPVGSSQSIVHLRLGPLLNGSPAVVTIAHGVSRGQRVGDVELDRVLAVVPGQSLGLGRGVMTLTGMGRAVMVAMVVVSVLGLGLHTALAVVTALDLFLGSPTVVDGLKISLEISVKPFQAIKCRLLLVLLQSAESSKF